MDEQRHRGTQLVKDIRPGLIGSDPKFLTVSNAHLFLSADNGVQGAELWDPPLGSEPEEPAASAAPSPRVATAHDTPVMEQGRVAGVAEVLALGVTSGRPSDALDGPDRSPTLSRPIPQVPAQSAWSQSADTSPLLLRFVFSESAEEPSPSPDDIEAFWDQYGETSIFLTGEDSGQAILPPYTRGDSPLAEGLAGIRFATGSTETPERKGTSLPDDAPALADPQQTRADVPPATLLAALALGYWSTRWQGRRAPVHARRVRRSPEHVTEITG